MNIPNNYAITADKTVPDPAKIAVKGYGQIHNQKPFMTPKIGDTWQDGSKLVPMLFGAGRGRSSALEGGDYC